MKSEKLETENFLIDEKNCKDLVIYFTNYASSNLIKMLSLHYHKLTEKIEEHEEKKYLMVDDYLLGRALDNIKEITGIEKFDGTKILIDTVKKMVRWHYFQKSCYINDMCY